MRKSIITITLVLAMLLGTLAPVSAAELLAPQKTQHAATKVLAKSNITKSTNGPVKNKKDGKWYYYKNGKVNRKFNGVVKITKKGKYALFTKGVYDPQKDASVQLRGLWRHFGHIPLGNYFYFYENKVRVINPKLNKTWTKVKYKKADKKDFTITRAKHPNTGRYCIRIQIDDWGNYYVTEKNSKSLDNWFGKNSFSGTDSLIRVETVSMTKLLKKTFKFPPA